MKTRFFLSVFLALAFVATSALNTSTVLAGTVCDSNFVKLDGNTISVKPTGVDDTANLQCAFDLAVEIGSGMEVTLTNGTFYTAQIVVNDFHGGFSGAGIRKTIIHNVQGMYVAPVDFFLAPPSAENPWPSLFSFVHGDITVSDLTIKIKGDNPTMGWTIHGIDPPLKELGLGIVLLGTEAHARVDRVSIEGEPMENTLYGYSLINGIFFEGFMGDLPWPPISGSFEVYDSIFRYVASGTPVMNLSNARVIISHNRFENVFFGMDGSDLIQSSLEFSHNQVDAVIGFDLYNSNIAQDENSRFLIKNNTFRGAVGAALEQIFGPGNTCLILGNNIQNVTDVGVYLGPDVTGCTVVGGNTKANVINMGTNNILVGVNNMGTGVGPTISDFLRRKQP